MRPRPYQVSSPQSQVLLIADTTDRMSVRLIMGGSIQEIVIVPYKMAFREVAVSLGRGPEVRFLSRFVEIIIPVARRKSTEIRGIIRRVSITWTTIILVRALPSRSGCQCAGNIGAVAAALVARHTAHVILQLRPLGITRHMPSFRADALTVAGERLRHRIG